MSKTSVTVSRELRDDLDEIKLAMRRRDGRTYGLEDAVAEAMAAWWREHRASLLVSEPS